MVPKEFLTVTMSHLALNKMRFVLNFRGHENTPELFEIC